MIRVHAGRLPSWIFASFVAVALAVMLLGVGAALVVYSAFEARAARLRQVAVQADVLADSVSNSLASNDPGQVRHYLKALRVDPAVDAAGVYDLTGRLIASFTRGEASPPAINPVGPPRFEGGHGVAGPTVVDAGSQVGSVYLRTSQEPLWRRAPRYGGIALLAVVATLIIGVLGALNASLRASHRRLQREMHEREQTERALRESREREAVAQLEIVAARSRAAVRESEQQLEFALRAADLGSWAIDLRTGAVTASAEFLANLGVGPGETLSHILEISSYVHPDDREKERSRREQVSWTGGEFESEFRTLGSASEVRWMLMRGRVVEDAEGGRRSLAGVSLDITGRMREQADRRVIEDQLRQTQKLEAIGQLTGGVSHDFNNLLGVIVGNLDMLLDAVRDDPASAELARDALAAAERGAELTKRLLAVARQQPLEASAIDLNALLPGAVAMLRRTLGEAIQIRTSYSEDLRLAEADSSQVVDALLNLAINARDAMPAGGVLSIETANATLDADFAAARAEVTPGEYVMLSVTDTGSGMTPEVIARATEPFFTTKPAGKGTGLGLSMIYGFAKQSGGHLSIYSELGVGTTIRLYLPCADADRAGEAGADAEGAGARESLLIGGETILVVDDNADLRKVAVRRLTALGYSCREAESGPQALNLLSSGERFDLLFTDIGLPDGLSGYQLAELARQRQSRLKVLYTTGYAVGRNRHLEEGEAATLRKPYRSEELAEAVRNALDSA